MIMNSENCKTQDFFISTETLEVSEGCPGSPVIQLTVDDVSTIRQPRLFYRKSDNSALLRLNFSTYYPVTVPEDLRRDLRKLKNIDIAVTCDSTSRMTMKPAAVSHVLQFPDIYEMNLHPETSGNREDTSANGDDDDDDGDETGENEADEEMVETEPFELDFDDDDDDDDDGQDSYPAEIDSALEEDFEHLSCREMVRQWTADHEEISVYLRECGDINFCLFTDGWSKILLLSLFEQDGLWLADEQMMCGTPALYFSETDHVVSPLFAVAAVADHLQCRTGVALAATMALFDDAAALINSKEIDEDWHCCNEKVCCGNRAYQCENMMKFADRMDHWFCCDDRKFTPEQIDMLLAEFNKLDESNISKVYDTFLRTEKLLYATCCKLKLSDSINAWFTGNYSENVRLGRYYDDESGYFFNLVYNWSDTAIILEYDKPEQRPDPVDSVLAIREKLKQSGTVSALVPCIAGARVYTGTIPDGVKYYQETEFFALEKYSFPREMGFDESPGVPRSDVIKLVRDADAIFQRCKQPEAEAYTPENERFMLETLRHIECAFSRRKVYTVYDTTSFERSIWTMVLQNEDKRVVIVFKEAGEENFESRKEEFEKEVFIDEEHIFRTTAVVTVVLVPEQIARNREEHWNGSRRLVYTGKDEFAELVCRILINC